MVTRAKQFAVALVCATALGAALVPILFEHALRGQLASLGFTDVQLSVASIGVNRVVLDDVEIDDVRLGRVEIEPGLRLLWADPQRVRIPDAVATAPAVAAAGAKASRSPAKRTMKPGRVELSVSVRDPSAHGWSATATGTVVFGNGVRLDRGHLEVEAPSVRESSVVAAGVSLSFDASGTLSPLAITGAGAVRAKRVELGPVTLASARLPFSLAPDGLAFGSGSATLFGGTVTSRPFAWKEPLVLDATGLRLDRMTGSKSPVAATGLVDGQLAINVGSGESLLARGHLRARSTGTLKIRDPNWRARLAAAGGAGASAVTKALLSFQYDKLALEVPKGAPNTMTLALAGRGVTNHQPLELLVRVNGVQDAARLIQEGP